MSGGHDWCLIPKFIYPVCSICGVVQRRDGKNKPCKGPARLRSMEQILKEKPETIKIEFSHGGKTFARDVELGVLQDGTVGPPRALVFREADDPKRGVGPATFYECAYERYDPERDVCVYRVVRSYRQEL